MPLFPSCLRGVHLCIFLGVGSACVGCLPPWVSCLLLQEQSALPGSFLLFSIAFSVDYLLG
jgi:hypothetical protein